jgi:hypothetical protein
VVEEEETMMRGRALTVVWLNKKKQ